MVNIFLSTKICRTKAAVTNLLDLIRFFLRNFWKVAVGGALRRERGDHYIHVIIYVNYILYVR